MDSDLKLGMDTSRVTADSQVALHQLLKNQESLINEYRDQGQELVKLVDTLRDRVSKQANLNRLANQYVDHVSHEFRTPLSVVNDCLQILLRGLAGSVTKEQRYLLDSVSVQVAQLNTMVEDILDVSRLEAGTIAMRRRIVTPYEILEKIGPILERRAKLKHVELTVEDSDAMPEIFCDPEKVTRALSNIAMNGIKFCRQPGRVAIQVERAGNWVRFSVTDNGHGIPKEELTGIFERFHQRETTRYVESTGGFGLGLAIAKELIDLSFGDLRVRSQIGIGSEFSFTVPVAESKTVLAAFSDYLRRGYHGAEILSAYRVETHEECDLSSDDSVLLRCTNGEDLLLPLTPGVWLLVTREKTAATTIERIHSILEKRRIRNELRTFRVNIKFLRNCRVDNATELIAFTEEHEELSLRDANSASVCFAPADGSTQ